MTVIHNFKVVDNFLFYRRKNTLLTTLFNAFSRRKFAFFKSYARIL